MRFTIRDLLWLALAVGLAMTCFLERDKRLAAEREFRRTRAMLTMQTETASEFSMRLVRLQDSYDALERSNKALRNEVQTLRFDGR
jgi:hypothetical protein